MADITRAQNGEGQIERFGTTAALADQITENFTERGALAARLTLATLTETPYAPTVGGVTYERVLAGSYQGPGEGKTFDTVEEAAALLEELRTTEVPNAAPLELQTYETKYRSMAKAIFPGKKVDSDYVDAFLAAFVEKTEELRTPITDIGTAWRIIRGAPRKVTGLRLGDHDRGRIENSQQHAFITTAGRQLILFSKSEFYTPKYFLAHGPNAFSVGKRGGVVPGSSNLSRIKDRALKQRTKNTKR